MKKIYIDCQSGIAGDMLMAGFFDLGVPIKIVTEKLDILGLGNSYSLNITEGSSSGLRGLRVDVKSLEPEPPIRRWKDIKHMVSNSSIGLALQQNILSVFKALAEAEAFVHSVPIDDVHFHEIGSIDSLVDIIGVCTAIDYLKPIEIFCSNPPMGSGFVRTDHGTLPVPVPAVLEIARNFKITLSGGDVFPVGELTTPTGLALIAVLANNFAQPNSLTISSIGVGLGKRETGSPNLLRVCELFTSENELDDVSNWQTLISQEAWIDDSTPEDISSLLSRLRKAGAIEVITYPINMKKGRQAVCIKAIMDIDKAIELRRVWFSFSTTLGLREKNEGRWVLSRRLGTLKTSFGLVRVKQVQRPDMKLSCKVEHDELIRISESTGLDLDEIRREVLQSIDSFSSDEEWSW